jgi:hypothetical protein
MVGNDLIYEIYARMYVVLRKAEKHVPHEEFTGATEYLMV